MAIAAGSGVLGLFLMFNLGGYGLYGMSLLGYPLTIGASSVLCRRTSFRNRNVIIEFIWEIHTPLATNMNTRELDDFWGHVPMSSHVPLDGDLGARAQTRPRDNAYS
ncbi:hypothetical protein RHS04_06919 [Rhizoctonia solani]|uniref:Uncharacterized protein n=1 Tax=Rhizoctonia solani TaxID=456999 RepID=A0A8H7H5X0_9AGAM|nr:hypothetical protein RHS04_06919 [Rhizoctonia solani]KAF8755537.1 hypothetical protein RHS01_05218 [Rhizoctonia solani]